MITPEQYQHLTRILPPLQRADERMARDFQAAAFYARIPAGRDVFVEGDQADAIAFLVSGAVRVYKIGETGREITLYRFGLGSSCVLTANAILSQRTFPAIATVEKDAEAVMVPAGDFRRWVRQHDVWLDFVLDLLSERLSTVMEVIDSVVFQRMDRRVAAWLAQRAEPHNPVRATHQEIAADLGSSREVVSRILDDLSSAGLVETGRGTIRVLDRQGLDDRAAL